MSLRFKSLKSGIDSLRGKPSSLKAGDGHGGGELGVPEPPALPAKSPKKEHHHHDEIHLPSSSSFSLSTSRVSFSAQANVKLDKRIVSLPVISDEEAASWLEEQPDGSTLVRLDNNALHAANLVLSYKYHKLVFHHVFEDAGKMKLKSEKGQSGEQVLTGTMEKKMSKCFNELVWFCPKLRRFINEMISNRNYVEQELNNNADLERELNYRKYIIFPSGKNMVVKRKSESGIHSVTISIDFSRGQLMSRKDSKKHPSSSSGGSHIDNKDGHHPPHKSGSGSGMGLKPIPRSFSEYLLEFLKIDPSDKLLVAAVLGFHPKDEQDDLEPRPFDPSDTPSLLETDQTHGNAERDRAALIEMLRTLVTQATKSDQATAAAGLGNAQVLRQIHSATKVLQTPAEKMQWVTVGLFDLLIGTICLHCNHPTHSELPLRILKHLVNNNLEAAEILCDALYGHVDPVGLPHGGAARRYLQCGGVALALHQLVRVEAFRKVFVASMGVPRLLDMYYKASVLLLSDTPASMLSHSASAVHLRNTSDGGGRLRSGSVGNVSMIQQRTNSISTSSPPLPEALLMAARDAITTPAGAVEQHETSGPIEAPSSLQPHATNEGEAVPTPGTGAPPKSPGLPKLDLRSALAGTTKEGKKGSRVSSRRLSTLVRSTVDTSARDRSSRGSIGRLDLSMAQEAGGSMIARAQTTEFTQTSGEQQLFALARNLGEIYLSGDLSALVMFKQDHLAQQRRANMLQSQKEQQQHPQTKQADEDPLVRQFRRSPYYHVKCNILRTLAVLFTFSECIERVHTPINLLFSELRLTYRDANLKTDHSYRKLVWNVLDRFADYIEFCHRVRWTEITGGMTASRKICFRRKLDLFVWRVEQRLEHIREDAGHSAAEETNILLNMLSEYIRHCRTRVMLNQIVDVCMETLLRLKHVAFNGLVPDPENITMNTHLYNIFDALASASKTQPQLLPFFVDLFLENEDSFLTQLKSYLPAVLFNSEVISLVESVKPDGPRLLERVRVAVISHFRTCVTLIAQLLDDWHRANPNPPPEITPPPLVLLAKLEFLIAPNGGYVFEFLNASPPHRDAHVKMEMLQLLHQIFSLQGSPYIEDKFYFDSYIGFHYRSFVLLYNSGDIEPDCLTLCRMHLQILLAFSKSPNDKVALKFYQLRVIDFLVREVSLEYDIDHKREKHFQLSDARLASSGQLLTSATSDLRSSTSEMATSDEAISAPATDRTTTTAESPPLDPSPVTKETVSPILMRRGSSTLLSRSPSPHVGQAERVPSGSALPRLSLTGLPARSASLTSMPTMVPQQQALGRSPLALTEDPSRPQLQQSVSSPVIPAASRTALPGTSPAAAPASSAPVAVPNNSAVSPRGSAPQSSPRIAHSPRVVPSTSPRVPSKLNPNNTGSASSSSGTDGTRGSSDLRLSLSSSNSSLPTTMPGKTSPHPKPSVLPKLGSMPPRANAAPVSPQRTSLTTTTGVSAPLPIERALSRSRSDSHAESDNESDSSSSSSSSSDSSSDSDSDASDNKGAAKTSVPPPKAAAKPAAKGLKGLGLGLDLGAAAKDAKKPGLDALPVAKESARNANKEAEGKKTVGGLGAIEQLITVSKEDPKLQVALERLQNKQNAELIAQEEAARVAANADAAEKHQRYVEARAGRKVYLDRQLHLTWLQLIFQLFLTPAGLLQSYYADQYPLNNKKPNVPFLLSQHINHPENAHLVPDLCAQTMELGAAPFRLLKLLCTRLFQPSLYSDMSCIAKGAFGSVYKCTMKDEQVGLAVKLMSVPKTIHDRCVLHDIFTEIHILDTFKTDPHVCHLYDYGVDASYFWITMKLYRTSLKSWRLKQTKPLSENLLLYLQIYMQVLETLEMLVRNHILHFDIKCDNFLLEPIDKNVSDEDFYQQKSDVPNFWVHVADFGEAKVWQSDDDAYTYRNRGTEFNKSPEMLQVAYASQKTRATYDRRKHGGASTASDIWSVGCLLYELLTGEFLFYDNDWVRFFIRVTSPSEQLLTPEKKAKIGNNPILVEFLEFVLLRKAEQRPRIADVILRFKYILSQFTKGRNEGNRSSSAGLAMTPRSSAAGAILGTSPQVPKHIHTGNLAPQPGRAELSVALHDTPAEELPVQAPRGTYDYILSEGRYFMETPSKILDNVFIGSYVAALNKDRLKKQLEITGIINCTEAPCQYPGHFEYLHLKLLDEPKQDILGCLPDVFEFINRILAQGGRVLVMSERGQSRSASLVIAYVMSTRFLEYLEAFTFVKDRRYSIMPNRGFKRQLCEWWNDHRAEFAPLSSLPIPEAPPSPTPPKVVEPPRDPDAPNGNGGDSYPEINILTASDRKVRAVPAIPRLKELRGFSQN